MSEESQTAREGILLRMGAVCLIVGSILVLVFRTVHGDLPTDTGEAALSYVSTHPLYALVHLSDVLGFLVFAGGLVAFSSSLTNRVAWAVGRLGMASVLVGAAVHIVDFSADGFSLPVLASSWIVASPSERASLELAARVALVVIGGPSVLALVFLWGTTLVLYGLAARQEGYSNGLGWIGVILGVVIFVLGTAFYLKPNLYPGALLYGGGTWAAHLWAIWLGVAMWRRGSAYAVAHAPQRQAGAK